MITVLSPVLPLKTLILQRLKADAELTAIVAARIYTAKPGSAPVRPFIRIDTPLSSPTWHDGGDGGSSMSGLITCYTANSPNAQDPEAAAARINAHVVRILSGVDAVLEGEVSVSIVPTIDQVLRDPEEADVWNGIVRYDALAS